MARNRNSGRPIKIINGTISCIDLSFDTICKNPSVGLAGGELIRNGANKISPLEGVT